VTVRFLADEDLHGGLIEGLRSREPAIDVLDVKSAALRGTADPALLELAAQEGRIVITHDRAISWTACAQGNRAPASSLFRSMPRSVRVAESDRYPPFR
jgi:hypothetical protein